MAGQDPSVRVTLSSGQPDPLETILRGAADLTPAQRAAAWDVFQQAGDPEALTAGLQSLNLPQTVKADLWDLKQRHRAVPEPAEAAPTVPEPAEAPWSVGGFGENILTSGGKLLSDTWQGAKDLAGLGSRLGQARSDPHAALKLRDDALTLIKNSPEIGTALVRAFGDRYGSPQAIATTAYQDPLGMVSDLSTLLGGTGAVLKLGKAPGAIRLGTQATRVSGAIDPLGVAARGVGAAAKEVGTGVITAGLRPSAAVRAKQGSARQIAQTVQRERIASKAEAGAKLKASSAEVDRLLAEAEAAGHPGISGEVPIRAVESSEAGSRAGLREALGQKKDPKIQARLERLRTEYEIPGQADVPPTFRDIPLTRAQALKREAQDLAYEAGKRNKTLATVQQRALAQALKQSLEEAVPAIAPVNKRSQELFGLKQAFGAAENRPSMFGTPVTLGAGLLGAAATGEPGVLLGALGLKALESPRVTARTGTFLGDVGTFAARPDVAQLMQTMRVAGLSDEEVDAALTRILMEPSR